MAGTNFLGTTDNVPLELKVNGSRALRLEPGQDPNNPTSPNLIGGGGNSTVSAGVSGATIGGGGLDAISADFATVAGGQDNAASGFGSSIGGGRSNRASGSGFSTIGGGNVNNASGSYATIAGGGTNTASAQESTVGGGGFNEADGPFSAIVGGHQNIATGSTATVAGGVFNSARGDDSFAAGLFASALHDGSFVWADDNVAEFRSTAKNEFSARATGGVRFVTAIDSAGNPTAGVSLAAGSGSWSNLSDRALKRNFSAVDGSWILDRLAGLSITTWSYKAQKPSIRHLGPTAQDFARAFGLGEDPRRIDTIDSEGISLAGIQALYTLALKQQRQLHAQQRELDVLKAQVAKLGRRRASASH